MSSSNLILFVPTRGREHEQITLENLLPKWRKRTVVVCPANEAKNIAFQFPDLKDIQTPRTANVSEKRSWILRYAGRRGYDRIMMLDDDLEFLVRQYKPIAFAGYGRNDPAWKDYKADHPGIAKLVKAEHRLDYMFDRIQVMLEVYAHGGISQRFMNQEGGKEFILNRKARQANAFHVPTTLAHCKLNRTLMAMEYDLTLQLLSSGYENAIYQWGALHEPNGYRAPGGVSLYRNNRNNNESKIKLAQLHPGIVLVQPNITDRQMDEAHVDFKISWRKAIQQGLAKRGTQYGTISGKAP